MKSTLALLSALCLAVLARPASAHHLRSGMDPAYLVFWSGVAPKSASGIMSVTAARDFWSKAFVSKYRIVGASVPSLQF
jgi:hypothetical protein